MDFGSDRYGHPVTQAMLDLFANTTAIRVEPNVQGQRIDVDGTIVIGARAAYQICASNLFHELGHFVEIDTRRMGVFGWGLRCKTKVRVMGEMYDQPTTHQFTDRENRVIAFQVNLAKHFGIELDISEWARTLRFLPDTSFVPIEDGTPAFGDDKTHSLDYNEIEKSQARWCEAQIREYMKVLTVDLFFSEWERRLKILKQRQKRRKAESK